MSLALTLRRNRFKSKPPTQKAALDVAELRAEWRIYLRRGALLLLLTGALSALTWALDRPVRVISIDGSFQRVSPGQIEKAVAPYANAGFMSADLDDIQRAVEALPWVDHARIARRWPNSLRVTRDRANRGGALGRVGSAQYPRRTVRQSRERTCPRSCRA